MYYSQGRVYGHQYSSPRQYKSFGPAKQIEATNIKPCSDCGAQVSMQWSTNKNKEYATDVHMVGTLAKTTRSSFHNCQAKQKQPARVETTLNVKGIFELFERASAHLKHPKIRLMVPGKQMQLGIPLGFIDPKDEVVLARAGARSSHPGQIRVTDGRDYGYNSFFGYIKSDGHFEQTNQITKEVSMLVEELAKDPAGVAKKYGALTGNCCFCNRSLETDNSTAVGYGPTCAKHYGLPWGQP
jgi:uncharacterized protein DUF6011